MTLFIYASAVLMVDFVGHEAETQEDTVVQERSSLPTSTWANISSCKCEFASGSNVLQ